MHFLYTVDEKSKFEDKIIKMTHETQRNDEIN